MKVFFKDNLAFIFLIVIWIIGGMLGGALPYLLIPLTLLLLKKKGFYAELILGFFLILTFSDSRSPLFNFADEIKEIYILMLFLFLLFDKKSFVSFNSLYKYLIPFFAIALICLLYSETLLEGAQKTLSYFLLVLIVPNYIQKAFIDKGSRFFRDLVFLCTSILIIGLILKFINPLFVMTIDRYQGLLGNPNGLGVYALLFFLMFFVISDTFPQLFSKNEKLLVWGVLLFSIILCESRTTIFAILIFYLFRSIYKLPPLLAFIVFLMIVFSYQAISSNFEGIVSSIGLKQYFRVETLKNGSGRLVAWEFAWNSLQKNIFIGKGFGYTEYLYLENWQMLSRLGHQGAAHNMYLTLWLDTGLVGLVLYLVGFVSMFLKAFKKSKLALPILYSILFSSFFESWLTASLNPFTIQIFIILTILTSDIIIDNKDGDKTEVPVPL